MTTLDIRGTVVGDTALALKAPCLVATTGSNITLSGVQTIAGVTVGNNSERVLVKDQTTQSQNGIYIAATGAWVLAADFTSNNNVALGTWRWSPPAIPMPASCSNSSAPITRSSSGRR